MANDSRFLNEFFEKLEIRLRIVFLFTMDFMYDTIVSEKVQKKYRKTATNPSKDLESIILWIKSRWKTFQLGLSGLVERTLSINILNGHGEITSKLTASNIKSNTRNNWRK